MKKRKPALDQFAVCVGNAEYPSSLELHKVYPVLPDEQATKDGYMHVIDESGEDYLFPDSYFMVLDLPAPQIRALKKSFQRSLSER